MSVVTRFAPSPTGYLHIGGARTALFNWLFAKANGGKYLLRIEDTDRERSTDQAIDAILSGLDWLGLPADEKEIYQFSRAHNHVHIAKKLLNEGKAYYCYCSQEELSAMREKAKAEGLPLKYDGTWRDRDPADAPKDVKPVIRLKAPLRGSVTIKDLVQGDVTVGNEQLDDMILVRSDGTPTYMLAVVVDDHDMGVTHVIRGDDHLTNAFRQTMLYEAIGWDVPEFAHIPLIHGADGAKLSKRHGALGVEAYRDMGYLPEAMRNYLLRLGWSHGDDEIISTEQAIEWFNLDNIGRSPARFDINKLDSVNSHYIKEADNEYLYSLILPLLPSCASEEIFRKRIISGLEGLKPRARTLLELAGSARFYVEAPKEFTDKAKKNLDEEGKNILTLVIDELLNIHNWNHDNLYSSLKQFGEEKSIKLGSLMGPVRSAITGSHASPSMFEVMENIGKDETLKRLNSVI